MVGTGDRASQKDEFEHQANGASALSPAQAEPSVLDIKFRDMNEKAVFELQLTQLQEQLIAAMIENQNLRKLYKNCY